MTREEAIKALELEWHNHEHGGIVETAIDMAIAALREQEERSKVVTQADRIRAMTDEELAKLLVCESVEYTVDYDYDENPIDNYTPCWRASDGSTFWDMESAVEFELAWLQQPYISEDIKSSEYIEKDIENVAKE